MKFNFIVILFLINVFILQGEQNNHISLYTNETVQGTPLNIMVDRGEFYNSKFKLDIYSIYITPQMAIWVEDMDGTFLETLYVTNSLAKQKWQAFIKLDNEKSYRSETLPRWLFSQFTKTGFFPSRENPLPDAITGATPFSSFILTTKTCFTKKKVKVMFEVNMAFDDNSNFSVSQEFGNPNANGTSGQPSLIYSGVVDLSKAGDYPLILVGYGSPTGVDGSITPKLELITTAKDIIKKVTIRVGM